MRDVAIVSVAQTALVPRETRSEGELVQEVTQRALADADLEMADIGFTCSGSSDYVVGRPFSFLSALDGIQAWPPIQESHVEMDGAWALYEAWVKLQIGHIDTALVFAFGQPSIGDLPKVLTRQLDPYTMAPLWPDAVSLAALQARALLDASSYTERDFAEVAARIAWAADGTEVDPDALLRQAYEVAPLRKHDVAVQRDGAAALVLVAGERARSISERPAWIRGIAHNIEPHQLGLRDLAVSESTSRAAAAAGVRPDRVDAAELHAYTTAQEIIVRDALGLDPEDVDINPSGGSLANDTIMVSGLLRFIEAATRVIDGRSDCAVAHATSGPALQQNMVAVLEGE